MEKFNTFGTKTSCVLLENPEQVRRSKESRRRKGSAGSRGGWERFWEKSWGQGRGKVGGH